MSPACFVSHRVAKDPRTMIPFYTIIPNEMITMTRPVRLSRREGEEQQQHPGW